MISHKAMKKNGSLENTKKIDSTQVRVFFNRYIYELKKSEPYSASQFEIAV